MREQNKSYRARTKQEQHGKSKKERLHILWEQAVPNNIAAVVGGGYVSLQSSSF